MTRNNPSLSARKYDNEDVIDLRFLIGLLKTHKWFIFVITLGCVILGGGYSIIRPAMYESTALIKVNGDSSANASNVMAMLGMATGAATNSFMNASPTEVETSLIQSNYIMGPVAEELGLNISVIPKHLPVFGGLLAKLLPESDATIKVTTFNVPKALEATPFQLTIENMADNYILSTPNNHIILRGKIGELATSQDQSMAIKVERLKVTSVHQFIVTKQPLDIVTKGLIKNLTIKEQGDKTGILAISYTSKDPEEAQRILNAILKTAVEKNIAERAEEATKTVAFLQEQLPAVSQNLDASEKQLNVYRAKTGTVDDKIEAALLLQEILSLEKDLNELNLKKLEILENFTAKHPYILAIDQKQKKLEQKLEEVKLKLRQLPLTAQEADNFQRDIKVNGEIYAAVMQNLQQMQLLQGSTVSSVKILEAASFPVLPIPSRSSLFVLISLAFGISLATAILLLQYSLSKTLDPLLLEKVLGIQVLAVIPYSVFQEKLFKEMCSKKTHRQHYLLSLAKPKNVSVEALRSLRTSLKLATLSDDKKVMAISGCSPNVGKSFVSANLITLLADLGKKVLLIDADMRKGYLHKMFAVPHTPGLSEYLQGKNSLESSICNVLPNVDLMRAGAYPSNPVELLMQPTFAELIKQVSKNYEFVLIDTPPILAVTDASLIFKCVDIRLLLVGLAKDQLKEIEHTKGVLEKAGIALDGIVCNYANHQKKYGYQGNCYAQNYYYEYGQ